MANAAKRPHLPELDLVRAFGIIAVVMIHATSSIVNNYDRASSFYPIYVFLNVFSKFAVPVFIFLSGFVLFYNYIDKPFTARAIGEFYKKRLMKTVIPFLLFSFLYWGLTRLANYGFTDIRTFIGYFANENFLEKLLTGKTYTHLYFVVIILQFYILAPLLLYAVKRLPWLGKHIVWLGLLVQWAFIYKLADVFELKNRGSYSFTYMLYFAAGAFIGIYYLKLADWIKISKQSATAGKITAWAVLWTLFLSASLTEVYVYYRYYLEGRFVLSPKLLELVNEVHCVAAGIALIQLSAWIYAAWNRTIVKALIHIGAVSFGIYLIHPIVLYVYREIDAGGNPLIYHLWAAGGFVLALCLPWLLVSLSARFRWHWILFGPLPAAKKAPAASAPKKPGMEA
ncbi:acyltransferase [Paenibacillus arenilitoris]|uniref:Acyltransferase n=1 Tax=Paenibacillus arenilitoris TaxID=2772299 RepID=A0A927CN61_9BACL|nr:acyltransferase [Paenibacillus arenilitoris]MBD2869226.1 acyltransferase [Paenibacillus arenilitoris]